MLQARFGADASMGNAQMRTEDITELLKLDARVTVLEDGVNVQKKESELTPGARHFRKKFREEWDDEVDNELTFTQALAISVDP